VVPIAMGDPAEELVFDLQREGVLGWDLRNGTLLNSEDLPGGHLSRATVGWEGARPFVDLVFNRSLGEIPPANAFVLVHEDAAAGSFHLGVRKMDTRRLRLRPLSGTYPGGNYILQFKGPGAGRYGRDLQKFRRKLFLARPMEEASAGAEPADLGSGGLINLTLEESPVGSGRLSAFTSGTFSVLGREARKTFEVELESGDQLSAYIDLIEPGADYRLRVEDADGTEVFGGYWGTDHPLQRIPIAEAGTYRVQAWVDHQTTDIDLRIDVGRGLYLE